ncbi:MAG: zf-HC2 domain-containing protein [Deltaproteobacteria bacterium]|nr:zf-HC2 domain-containing protein [Deltaproteobacteria bacterium]
MDCQEVRKFLQVYVDGEFDEDDRRDLEAHLAQCPDCRAQADYERRFREAIRARMPRQVAPAALREKLQQKLEKERSPSLPRRLVLSSIPAAALLALVATFTWTLTSGFSPLVDEAISRHSSTPPIEVNSSDSEEVEGWFRAKVNFRVALPRIPRPRFSLVGARLSHLAERQAALVRYSRGARLFSLFVVSDKGEELDGEHCKQIRQRKYCTTERRGYTVITWRAHGLLYSLVGDSSEQELFEMLDDGIVNRGS